MGYPSRRTFLKGSTVVAGAQLIPRQLWGAPSATDAVTTKLQQFDYGDVQLLEGPMREQFERNHTLFLALSDDSLPEAVPPARWFSGARRGYGWLV